MPRCCLTYTVAQGTILSSPMVLCAAGFFRKRRLRHSAGVWICGRIGLLLPGALAPPVTPANGLPRMPQRVSGHQWCFIGMESAKGHHPLFVRTRRVPGMTRLRLRQRANVLRAWRGFGDSPRRAALPSSVDQVSSFRLTELFLQMYRGRIWRWRPSPQACLLPAACLPWHIPVKCQREGFFRHGNPLVCHM